MEERDVAYLLSDGNDLLDKLQSGQSAEQEVLLELSGDELRSQYAGKQGSVQNVWNRQTGTWEKGYKFWDRRKGTWEVVRDVTVPLSIAKYERTLAEAVKLVGLPWIVDETVASGMQQEIVRERTKSLLKNLEHRVLREVTARMMADTHKLTPFEWDTPASRSEKEAVARQTELQLRSIMEEANRELDSPRTFTEKPGDTGTQFKIQYQPGSALRQLEEIRRTGQFWD